MDSSINGRFVFILGMHRSGTSCLAGSLERCGLYLGDVSRRDQKNPKGLQYELLDAVRINHQILTSNGGNWCQPPSNTVVNSQQKQSIKKITGKLTRHLPCGIKDPRLLLLLDTWIEIVDSYTIIGTFRHPNAVTRSLIMRNLEISEEMAYKLWARYNSEMVRWHKLYRFPIVEFNLSNAEAYRRTVVTLAIKLNLNPDMDQLRDYISPELDHNPSLEAPIPKICKEIYAYLQRHRYQPAISDDAFEARLLAAQKRYDGWQWSPDNLRRTLRPLASLLPHPFVKLGHKWIRRFDKYR